MTSSSWIAKLDGAEWPPLGWVERHWAQVGYQLAGTLAAFAWSFALTCLALFLLNLVPGLSLRASPAEEELGMDDVQLGEFAYDYVELTRHVTDSSGASSTGAGASGVVSSASSAKLPHEKGGTPTVA